MTKRKKAGRSNHFGSRHGVSFSQNQEFIFGRNNLSKNQMQDAYARMAARFPLLMTEIDQLIQNIKEKITKLSPGPLLHRAYWEYAAIKVGISGNGSGDREHSMALRMIDYVQSVIASTIPSEKQRDVSDHEWDSLKNDVTNLFTKITYEYSIHSTAFEKINDPNFDLEISSFKTQLEMHWIHVRGDRYQPHDIIFLRETLEPHSDILSRLFNIDAATLILELEKILFKLTGGIFETFTEMEELKQETFKYLSEQSLNQQDAEDGMSPLELFFNQPHIAAKRAKITGQLAGLDLFDLEIITNLPRKLLDELSWSPGDDSEFFLAGEFCGWPLRIWPTMKKPFLRLENRILCFDAFSLFGNFYRVIQRMLFRLEPNYKSTWNEAQKEVSETLPFLYFNKLLPESTAFKTVYYRWKTGTGPSQWQETDGIIIFDDHLFVIEVKAGAFTYTSPTTDLSAHIASLKNLVVNPSLQGNRFVDYLESAPEIAIFDEKHSEIGRLSRNDFRNITICTVTLDSITRLAAKAHHLKSIGLNIGSRPVLSLSIDDLRVYSDLMFNPLIFGHFIEKRNKAATSKHLVLTDEMDHLGLYFDKNNYAQYADDIAVKNNASLTFDRFSSEIDQYYSSIVQNEPAIKPQQKMPKLINEILEFLAKSSRKGRSLVAATLLDGDKKLRQDIANGIEQLLSENPIYRRMRPLSTTGEMSITVVVWSPPLERNESHAREHTQAVMITNSEQNRLLLELEFTEANSLKSVSWQLLDLNDIDPQKLAVLTEGAKNIRRMRVENATSVSKVGVNQQCPCGSGKKYKRCCRS